MQLLPRALGQLPLAATGWPRTTQQRLQRMGITTVADCLRLPRDGFARRTHPDRLQELDRALGQAPELFRYYQPPVVFHDRLGFAAEIDAVEGVVQAAQELLRRLGEFLRRRQLCTVHLSLHMEHYRRPPTRVELELREPSHTIMHLGELLQLKLDNHQLVAPVTGITMDANTTALEQLAPAQDAHIARLTERLRAKLGTTAVHGLELQSEHRPERAWRSTDVLLPVRGSAHHPAAQQRPLWLLPSPRRLEVRDGQPAYRGSLQLISDAERIESGWWDGQGIRRDYFIATGNEGRRWWIYRDRSEWYLHGIFG